MQKPWTSTFLNITPSILSGMYRISLQLWPFTFVFWSAPSEGNINKFPHFSFLFLSICYLPLSYCSLKGHLPGAILLTSPGQKSTLSAAECSSKNYIKTHLINLVAKCPEPIITCSIQWCEQVLQILQIYELKGC